MSDSNDQRVIFLDTDVAEELKDLVEDVPGDADEALLGDALRSLRTADSHLDADEQKQVAEGEAVAFGATEDEIETVETLIVENKEVAPGKLRSVASSLRSKLKAAAKKARQGNRRGRRR